MCDLVAPLVCRGCVTWLPPLCVGDVWPDCPPCVEGMCDLIAPLCVGYVWPGFPLVCRVCVTWLPPLCVGYVWPGCSLVSRVCVTWLPPLCAGYVWPGCPPPRGSGWRGCRLLLLQNTHEEDDLVCSQLLRENICLKPVIWIRYGFNADPDPGSA